MEITRTPPSPHKIQIFIWLALKNKIHTIDNLIMRGWIIPNMCCLCKQAAKKVQHLFSQCYYTNTVRQLLIIDIQQEPTELFIRGQFSQLILSEEEAFWRTVQVAFYYNIWKKRCRRIFQEKQFSLENIACIILKEITNWTKTYVGVSPVTTQSTSYWM
jgi:zinc-binding in reverse transcriptase